MNTATVSAAPDVYADSQGFAVRATDGTDYRVDIATCVLETGHPLLVGKLAGRKHNTV